MRITTNHPASRLQIPVILDGQGEPMSHAEGVKALRELLGMTSTQFSQALGARPRTAEGWEQGRRTPTSHWLYGMAKLLEDHEAKEKRE